MASRAEQKQQARAARIAAEEADRRAAARRTNLTRLGLVLGVAAVVVVVFVLVSRGGGGDSGSGANASASELTTQKGEVAAMFDGLTQDGSKLGDAKATYTMVEFADLQCPVCKRYTDDVLPSVIDSYVKTGKLRLDLKLRTFLGPDSVTAAGLAAAAAQQDKMWSFTEMWYRNQGEENSGYATPDFLSKIASNTPGLNAKTALAADENAASKKLIDDDEKLATALGSNSTPDFYIRRGDGGPLTKLNFTDLTPEAFKTAIDDAIS